MVEKISDNLLSIINTEEGLRVEFKEAKNGLPNNLFETICAMLNRNGGHIFLGVNDKGKITGINSESIKAMKQNFANLCNNPNKIFPTVHLDIKEYLYEEKHLLYIYIHESSDVHKVDNKFLIEMKKGIMTLQIIRY